MDVDVMDGLLFVVGICAHAGLLWWSWRSKAWLAVGINSAMIFQWIWWVSQWQ